MVITVTRNPYAPEFDQPSYDKHIAETFPIGGSVLQVKAIDQDQVTIAIVAITNTVTIAIVTCCGNIPD